MLTSHRLEDSESEQFTVTVGDTSKEHLGIATYTISKTVLTKSSEFFKKACNKDWKEGQTKSISLPDIWPDAFDLYLRFLNTSKVVVPKELRDRLVAQIPEENESSPNWSHDVHATQHVLTDAYILADMLMDINAKNAIIDSIHTSIKVNRQLPSLMSIDQIFAQTPEGSPLRRFFADWLAFASDTGKTFLEACSKELLVEVSFAAMEVARGNKLRPSTSKPGCTYHEHDRSIRSASRCFKSMLSE